MDSSVWIANFRRETSAAVSSLRTLDHASERVVVPDVVLLEVMRGARDDRSARLIEAQLSEFDIVEVGGRVIARDAAAIYRRLRSLGITVRSSIDLMIGAFCLRNDCRLLHQDRDFAPMQEHLGLRCL